MADEKTHIGGLQAAGMPAGGDGKAMDMNLADMLSAMIESTIAADQKAAEDYLEVLRTYALEPSEDRPGHEKLKMVDFEMTDNEGHRQIVSIPKLSLLPLPVLRVAEATFDIEAQVDISSSVSEESQKEFEDRYPLLRRPLRMMPTVRRATSGIVPTERRRVLPAAVRVRLAQTGTSKSESKKEVQKMTNVKVHIKLEPVVLPDGMRSLLQASDSTIQILDEDDKND